MKPKDLAELALLAAIWGASFLFIRLGAAAFGPLALTGLRVVGAVAWLSLCAAGGWIDRQRVRLLTAGLPVRRRVHQRERLAP